MQRVNAALLSSCRIVYFRTDAHSPHRQQQNREMGHITEPLRHKPAPRLNGKSHKHVLTKGEERGNKEGKAGACCGLLLLCRGTWTAAAAANIH